jgi:hypothetical protein
VLRGTKHRSSGQRAKNLNKLPTFLPDWGLIPEVRRRAASPTVLILLATLLLAQSLPRKRFLGPAFFARLHVKAMLLDFFDDVFLLHLALETAQGVLKRLILLNNYFSQFTSPHSLLEITACSVCRLGQHYAWNIIS